MDSVTIAQTVLDKCRKMTMSDRLGELTEAFNQAGITLSADGSTVEQVSSDASFTELSALLKSAMPTAAMTAKRVMSDNGI